MCSIPMVPKELLERFKREKEDEFNQRKEEEMKKHSAYLKVRKKGEEKRGLIWRVEGVHSSRCGGVSKIRV